MLPNVGFLLSVCNPGPLPRLPASFGDKFEMTPIALLSTPENDVTGGIGPKRELMTTVPAMIGTIHFCPFFQPVKLTVTRFTRADIAGPPSMQTQPG